MTFLFLFFDGPAYIKLHPSQKGKYTQKNNKKKFVALSSNVNKIERAKLNRWPLFSPLLILLLLSNAFCKHIENCTRAERKWKRRETHRSILFLLRLEKKREFLKIIRRDDLLRKKIHHRKKKKKRVPCVWCPRLPTDLITSSISAQRLNIKKKVGQKGGSAAVCKYKYTT